MPLRTQHPAQRRSRRPVLVAVLLVSIGGGLWLLWIFLSDPQQFPLRRVSVENDTAHVRAAQVQEAVKPLLTKGFLLLDPVAVRSALKRLTWVEDASVWREWPDQLRIRIIEYRPAARWQQNGRIWLLSSRGQLFAVPAAQMPPRLPLLTGPTGQQGKVFAQLQEGNRLLRPFGLWISDLSLDARGSWRCVLNQQLHLALGRGEALARLENWLAVYPQVRKYMSDNMSIDLRYHNGFAMMRTAQQTEMP